MIHFPHVEVATNDAEIEHAQTVIEVCRLRSLDARIRAGDRDLWPDYQVQRKVVAEARRRYVLAQIAADDAAGEDLAEWMATRPTDEAIIAAARAILGGAE